jgi:hypothetical protein
VTMVALATSDPNYELKIRFAHATLKLNDPMKAAMAIFADQPGRALQIVDKWMIDPIVTEEIERLVEENGPQSFLPTREQVLVDMKQKIDTFKEDTWIKGMELYTKVRGWVEKPGATPVQVNVSNVLVVPTQGSDDDWERRSSQSQRKLIDGAATRTA